MTKEEFKKNLKEAVDSIDGLSSDDLDFATEMLYDAKTSWSFNDFYDFAKTLAAEWGDVKYVLRQYDALPDLTSPKNTDLINSWFSDHPQAYRDICMYIKKEGE